MYWIIFISIMVLSLIVQSMLQSRFEKYSQVPTANGMREDAAGPWHT